VVIDRPILLIGVGGMLWRAWDELCSRRGIETHSPSLDDFDLTKPRTIERELDDRYSCVINCAGMTDVDGCETQQDLANAINGTGAGNLARRCAETDTLLVHYSTDYVFNGKDDSPYTTDQLRDPINAYGCSKALGEELIESSGCRHLIIRTSWLYAAWGSNFVLTMIELLRNKKVIKVVNDQRGRPTSAQHLVETSLRLIEQDRSGIFHATDGGECSWCEFAMEIRRLIDSSCAIEPCTTEAFPRPASRPANSVLDLAATEDLVGPMSKWESNLKEVINAI
jgi:dTDP-4-dehydrorhamnose reductase